MQSALKLTATVQRGGKIEILDPQLTVGDAVDIIVLLQQRDIATSRRSVVDVLAESPGSTVFQTAEEVDTYLREERDAWER